jgi:MoxR-like ATPase
MDEEQVYTGEKLKEKQTVSKNGKDVTLDAYLPSKDIIQAVNLAIQLKRPLLIMGEAGCGKTRLGESVAYQFHEDKMYDHFFRWDIKSTTKAEDGIYRYDALLRLHDANFGSSDIQNLNKYIDRKKPLSEAFTRPQNGIFPNILLIDEIDKADIDFPNDILLEIEEKVFKIPELGEEEIIEATSDVLILITSNQEKELSPAFLRRCIYCYIDFPKEERLKEIVKEHINGFAKDKKRFDKAFEIFNKNRAELTGIDKKTSTSELIDWFKILDIVQGIEKKEVENRSELETELVTKLQWLDNDDITRIPFRQVLLKTKIAYLENGKANSI